MTSALNSRMSPALHGTSTPAAETASVNADISSPPSVPFLNDNMRRRSRIRSFRRFRRIRSLFSCLLPRSSFNDQNRWKDTVKIDPKCEWIVRELIIKEVGKEGIAADCTPASLPMDEMSLQKQCLPEIGKETDSDDSSNCEIEKLPVEMLCRKAGIPGVQHLSDQTAQVVRGACKSDEMLSARRIDSTQTCPICWDSFKVGEKVCWSRNANCSHGFHLDCMLGWLQDHEKCPLCRCDYTSKGI